MTSRLLTRPAVQDLARARRAFAGLVDDSVGIIGRVDLVRPAPGAPEVFVAHADPCDTRPIIGMQAANRGAAASMDPDRAVVRACGEAVERYCSAFCPSEATRLATAAELRSEGATVLSQPELYPFSAQQHDAPGFPFERAAGRPQRWVTARRAVPPGRREAAADHAWVPASCVYVPYFFNKAVEPFTHMPISTGLAAGPGTDFCVDKGISEILERDALMVRWHNRIPAIRIDVDSCLGADPLLDRTLAAGTVGTAVWHLSLITIDVEVPIMLAALIDRDAARPLTSVGVAADPDPLRALLLAAEEALLTRVLLARSSELSSAAGADATTLRGHMLAHAYSAELRGELRFLTDPEISVSLPDLLDRFPRGGPSLVDRLAEGGLTAWWVDVTTADVALWGFRVVRTLVPGMQPLDNDHRYRYLGGRRLVEAPRRLGLHAAAPDERNPHPHPFP